MKFKQRSPFGATKTFSDGKIHSSDEGDLVFGVAADTAHGVVIVKFGTPVTWFGLPPEQARELARLLNQHADTVSQRPQ